MLKLGHILFFLSIFALLMSGVALMMSLLPGPMGPRGIAGPEGPIGPIGLNGTQGLQGEQGEEGLQGETGADGSQGIAGLDGNIYNATFVELMPVIGGSGTTVKDFPSENYFHRVRWELSTTIDSGTFSVCLTDSEGIVLGYQDIVLGNFSTHSNAMFVVLEPGTYNVTIISDQVLWELWVDGLWTP